MTTYDLDIDRPVRGRGKRSLGCAIGGWTAFAVLFCLIVFFGYRVSVYYGKIRRGELIDLPQFGSRFTTAEGSTIIAPSVVDRSEVESGDDPAEGPPAQEAKLTIVEFADFQCPFSKDEATIYRTLMRKYGDRVRFVYRDYPLESLHPDAKQAALAAECAREQGKFWAYHDKLYVNAPALAFPDLTGYAEQAGLDPVQFEKCLVDERYKDKVAADEALAAKLGLRGTPTFFLNGQRVEGAIPADVFEGLIEKLLK